MSEPTKDRTMTDLSKAEQELVEGLAKKLCWHCAEHFKNGYVFIPYQDTDQEPDDAWQIYPAAGTGENWSHLMRSQSGREITKKCKAWMLWAVVYSDCASAQIRSHTDALILAAYEACAKQADEWHIYVCHPDGCEHNQDLSALGEHIRSLAPDSARRAMEVREVKARRDFLLSVGVLSSAIQYRAACEEQLAKDCAALEHRRAELEEGRDG